MYDVLISQTGHKPSPEFLPFNYRKYRHFERSYEITRNDRCLRFGRGLVIGGIGC